MYILYIKSRLMNASFQPAYLTGYIIFLVMENKRHKIICRALFYFPKISRFINKYT